MLFNKKRTWKTLIITIVAVVSVSALSACGKTESAANQGDNSKVVATYKNGEITENEFDTQKKIMTFLSPEYAQLMEMDDFKTYLVKQKIAFEYLSGKASDTAKKAGEEQAGQQIAQMKKQVGDEQYKKMIDAQKLKEEDLKQYLIQVYSTIEDMKSKVTADDVKKQYDATKQDYTVANVRHVLIGLEDANKKERTKPEALKIAKDVKAQLDKGADFAEMAKKYSEDPGSKDNGGLYKDYTIGPWPAEFKQQVLTLPLNKISDPVESDLGYQIIKVESRTDTPFDKLTDAQKEAIKNNLGSAKIDAFIQNDLKDIIKKIDLPKSASTNGKTPATGTSTSTDGK
ncbi:peptidylprolyl isomerase [Paenibacillus pini]|uniref:Foldase protein PrsA n=1 Tax=Paenibacillus pini JCM 16418 TaxID=1236976 RepID=W7Z8C3_9BACL|nr:peptidylprolyl isomerase [Paenibacillus pini]GAF10659.1 foldase protein PrsA precursor [Paenibacillus pini JCM 16418]